MLWSLSVEAFNLETNRELLARRFTLHSVFCIIFVCGLCRLGYHEMSGRRIHRSSLPDEPNIAVQVRSFPSLQLHHALLLKG